MIYSLFVLFLGVYLGQEYNLPSIKYSFLNFMNLLQTFKKNSLTNNEENNESDSGTGYGYTSTFNEFYEYFSKRKQQKNL